MTRYVGDERQELTGLSCSTDGKTIVYVRGGDHGANWPADGQPAAESERRRLAEKGVSVDELVIPDDIHDFLLFRSWRTATGEFFERQFMRPRARRSHNASAFFFMSGRGIF